MPESKGLEQLVLGQLLEGPSLLLLQIIAQLQEANVLLRAEAAALKEGWPNWRHRTARRQRHSRRPREQSTVS
jgi:phage baseplate assembly protein gpV